MLRQTLCQKSVKTDATNKTLSILGTPNVILGNHRQVLRSLNKTWQLNSWCHHYHHHFHYHYWNPWTEKATLHRDICWHTNVKKIMLMPHHCTWSYIWWCHMLEQTAFIRLVQWHNYFGLTSGHRCFYMQIISGSFDLVTKITKTHRWLVVVVTLIPANHTKYDNTTYIATQMCSNTCVFIKTFIWISWTFNMRGVISEAIEFMVLVAYCAPYVYVMINMLADACEHPFTRIMTLCCCKNTVFMKTSSTNWSS